MVGGVLPAAARRLCEEPAEPIKDRRARFLAGYVARPRWASGAASVRLATPP